MASGLVTTGHGRRPNDGERGNVAGTRPSRSLTESRPTRALPERYRSGRCYSSGRRLVDRRSAVAVRATAAS